MFLRSYLELADWELKVALQSAKEDKEWESEVSGEDALKPGQIGVCVNFKSGKPNLSLKGTGHSPRRAELNATVSASKPKAKQKVIVHTKLPAIATKSAVAEDMYNVSLLLSSRSTLIFSHIRICFVDVL